MNFTKQLGIDKLKIISLMRNVYFIQKIIKQLIPFLNCAN
jgi:hypothetical protein